MAEIPNPNSSWDLLACPFSYCETRHQGDQNLFCEKCNALWDKNQSALCIKLWQSLFLLGFLDLEQSTCSHHFRATVQWNPICSHPSPQPPQAGRESHRISLDLYLNRTLPKITNFREIFWKNKENFPKKICNLCDFYFFIRNSKMPQIS